MHIDGRSKAPRRKENGCRYQALTPVWMRRGIYTIFQSGLAATFSRLLRSGLTRRVRIGGDCTRGHRDATIIHYGGIRLRLLLPLEQHRYYHRTGCARRHGRSGPARVRRRRLIDSVDSGTQRSSPRFARTLHCSRCRRGFAFKRDRTSGSFAV